MNVANIGKSSAELREDDTVKVKNDYAVRGGEIGTIAYFPNKNLAMVIFQDDIRESIPLAQLESSSVSAELLKEFVETESSEKNKFNSTEKELNSKQGELGLGKRKNSAMPTNDRLKDLKNSNPTDEEAQGSFVTTTNEINPYALINQLANYAEYLGKEHYRSIGKTIALRKPSAIADVTEMMANNEKNAAIMFEILANKYPSLVREIEVF